ncbi:phosphatase PAP2 family protein [Bacillus haimaensis]|uniref:phosphatase PAP2 family protein n=1 Tax=Bacillus haimaensis TaxID=3160967 RepID=UPI003AA997A0
MKKTNVMMKWLNSGYLREKWVAIFLVLLGMIVSVSAGGLFLELAEEVLEEEKFAFDHAIMTFLRSHEYDLVFSKMKIITEAGSVWWIASVTAITAVFLWFYRKDRWGVLFFIIANGGGGLLVLLLKHVFQRPRPSLNPAYDGNGFSFPSGHATGSIILYGFMIYLIARERKLIIGRVAAIIGLLFLIIFVGFSRVYLDVHYPSDILGGFAVGTIWLLFCLFSLEVSKIKGKRAFIGNLISHRN